jgi:hypothetical protein
VLPDLSAAACRGADPGLFDDTRYPDALMALSYCDRCTVIDLCMSIVRPSKSGFDGVAAGIVWRNGYKVRKDNSTRGDKFRRDECEESI